MRGLLAVAIVASFLYGLCLPSSSVAALAFDDNGGRASHGPLHIPIYHRFSNDLRAKAREHGVEWAFPSVPAKTSDYYRWTVRHDLARHGRHLAENAEALAFSDTNITLTENDGLQYAIIEVGSPPVPHFVALDTGSDLFWLPCECKACAPASSPAFEPVQFALNTYSPTTSNTSEVVACDNAYCSVDFSQCARLRSPGTSQCSYEVNYATANTSTSGTLYEDVIYLTEYQTPTTNITALIVLGCGQTQSGQLLDSSSVPDGILGLGRAPFSVPSKLSRDGLIGDSFSLCFNYDGVGRLAFGDFGSPDISTTPFLTGSNGLEASYFIGVESIQVGNESLNVSEVFLFDTGTSFTFIRTDKYRALITSFSRQETDYPRVTFDDVFELCYGTSDENFTIPEVTFELAGGASILIYAPVVQYYYQRNNSIAGFCLAVLDSGNELSIFGANFMVLYNLVFNREGGSLGFETKNCYDTETFSNAPAPVQAPKSAVSPGPSSGIPPPATPSPETSTVPSVGNAPTTVPGPAGSRTSSASRTYGSSSYYAFLLLPSILCAPLLQAVLLRF